MSVLELKTIELKKTEIVAFAIVFILQNDHHIRQVLSCKSDLIYKSQIRDSFNFYSFRCYELCRIRIRPDQDEAVRIDLLENTKFLRINELLHSRKSSLLVIYTIILFLCNGASEPSVKDKIETELQEPHGKVRTVKLLSCI